MNENIVVETSTIVESGEIDIEIDLICLRTQMHLAMQSIINSLNGHEFVETIHRVYSETVQRRENVFKLPFRNAAKIFIRELTSCLEYFNRDSEYKSIALKVYMILPSLPLQKPTRNK